MIGATVDQLTSEARTQTAGNHKPPSLAAEG
jgi:hypothetical protein